MTEPVDPALARGQSVLAQQPFSVLLGAELSVFAPGQAEIRLPIRQELRQQHGFVHGGVLAYLADNALTYAGGSSLSGQIVTAEMKINYTRPAIGELLIARASVVSAGRTQAVARCDVFVVAGGVEKLCAAAQGKIAASPAPNDPKE
ncbi:PaaI family thioesterase [Novosphingobium sp.]|uniref:PaaI family thioesterase n=1 Tax=Novosphingobium sp. TaxID=1874826 RepID=UPI0025E56B2C|nr:PaaI family thioesterase [Novosphingobium sp.]MCC6925891.1 PaaI family thioesterase [Novosphingobium sp.]